MSKNLFITGTGTDVGKTYISALIIKKLTEAGKKAAYFKAAMSGNVRTADNRLIPGDARFVKTISGIGQPEEDMCPYVYESAYSPHLAARIEGNPVDMKVIKDRFSAVCGTHEVVTVEGSGGIFCPIRFDETRIQLEDVIKELHLPCLIVADAGLGTINHTVLTVAYMKSRNIAVKGIILNRFHPGDILEEDNLKMCEYMTGVKVLACIKDGDTELPMDAHTLLSLYA